MYKVLFDLAMEYHFNSLYPLFLEFKKDPDYDLYFKVGKDPKKFLGLIKVSRKNEIISRLQDLDIQITDRTDNFDIVIAGDAVPSHESYGNPLFIHVDHGVGIKTSRIRNIATQKNARYHVFLEGQYWFDYIKSLNWQDVADFYLLGIPKLDPLFWPGNYDNEELIRKLEIDPSKKTVLFAPSYKPSCIEFVQEKILSLSEKFNLIVKLHPYSWSGRYAPHSHHRFYEKMTEENPNIFLIPKDDYDIYPYLVLADTLISDTSSVLNEFLALGKHGVIYILPSRKEQHSDGMDVLSIDPKNWLEGAFPHVYEPDGLLSAVEQAIKPTSEMINKLSEYRNYYFTGLDGRSSQRVKAKIEQLLKSRKNNAGS